MRTGAFDTRDPEAAFLLMATEGLRMRAQVMPVMDGMLDGYLGQIRSIEEAPMGDCRAVPAVLAGQGQYTVTQTGIDKPQTLRIVLSSLLLVPLWGKNARKAQVID